MSKGSSPSKAERAVMTLLAYVEPQLNSTPQMNLTIIRGNDSACTSSTSFSTPTPSTTMTRSMPAS